MTLLMFGIDDVHQWGDVFENNGTGTGTLGALYERRIEVGISAILLWYHMTLTLANIGYQLLFDFQLYLDRGLN